MKKFLIILLSLMTFSCSEENQKADNNSNDCDYISANEANPKCPHSHIDSIIPIIYGFPSEESFIRSDSGLVALGGCEISDCDPYWWCKIHEMGF